MPIRFEDQPKQDQEPDAEAGDSTPNDVQKPIWKLEDIRLLDPSIYLKQNYANIDPIYIGKANSWIERSGPDPSYGWVLLLGSDLNTLGNDLHQPRQRLSVTDGVRTFARGYLTCISTHAISSQYSDRTRDTEANKRYSPNTAYLVKLADTRYFARWGSINANFNPLLSNSALSPYSQPDNPIVAGYEHRHLFNWREMIQHIWDRYLPRVLGRLTISELITYPPQRPQNYRFQGCNAWDAFFTVINDIGLTLAPAPSGESGYYLYPSFEPYTDEQSKLFETARDKYLIKTEGGMDRTQLPQYVRVYFPWHGYQWHKQNKPPRTATNNTGSNFEGWDEWQDHAEFRPNYYRDLEVEALLSEEQKSQGLIVNGTLDAIYYNHPAITKSDNAETPSNLAKLNSIAAMVGSRRVNEIFFKARNDSHVFSGIWPLPPGVKYHAISYFDFGRPLNDLPEGTLTRLWAKPNSASPHAVRPLSTRDEREFPTPPTRITIGWLADPNPQLPNGEPDPRRDPQPCFGTCDPNESYFKGLPYGLGAFVQLYATEPDGTNLDKRVKLKAASKIIAYNVTGNLIPWNSLVILRFNPQMDKDGDPDETGGWEIISLAQRQANTVQQDCYSVQGGDYEFVNVFGQYDTLTINKKNGLRLIKHSNPNGSTECCREIILDFQPGPNNTVLHTDHNGGVCWSRAPITQHHFVEKSVFFGSENPLDKGISYPVSLGTYDIGGQTSPCHIYLPDGAGAVDRGFLGVGRVGKYGGGPKIYAQLGWVPPGYTGEVTIKGWLGPPQGDPIDIPFLVDRGLLYLGLPDAERTGPYTEAAPIDPHAYFCGSSPIRPDDPAIVEPSYPEIPQPPDKSATGNPPTTNPNDPNSPTDPPVDENPGWSDEGRKVDPPAEETPIEQIRFVFSPEVEGGGGTGAGSLPVDEIIPYPPDKSGSTSGGGSGGGPPLPP